MLPNASQANQFLSTEAANVFPLVTTQTITAPFVSNTAKSVQLQTLQDELQRHFVAVKQQEAKLIAARGTGMEMEQLSQTLMQHDLNSLLQQQSMLHSQNSMLEQLAMTMPTLPSIPQHLHYPLHHRAWTTDPIGLSSPAPGHIAHTTGRISRLGSIADDPLNVRKLPFTPSPGESISSRQQLSPSYSDASEITSSMISGQQRTRTGSVAGKRRARAETAEDLAFRSEEKRVRNRTHAKRSRLKKQQYYQNLEQQMESLREENMQLKNLMTQLLSKVENVVPQDNDVQKMLNDLQTKEQAIPAQPEQWLQDVSESDV
jgi:hypothetical protein